MDKLAEVKKMFKENNWFEELHLFERAEWIAMNVSRRAIRKPKGDMTLALVTDIMKQIDMYLKVVKT